ncbi:MAG: cbb3-type cytochrome c oxidase subunit 3 [Magnetococcales bacterium]|nr:cbb3-type cytochrome c oxidase subunit 3 [Magnetococcales bacterium]
MEFDEIFLLSKEIALVWFFLLFVAIVFWAFRPANKKRFEKMSRMALDDDDEPGQEESNGKQ